MRAGAAPVWRAGVALGLLLPLAAGASEPEWGLKATAGVAAPVAQGDGRSIRLSLEPQVKGSWGGLEWRLHHRLRWLDQGGERRTDADLREFSATWRGAQSSLRLGAQQVHWGRMDIVRVADLVNPVDQRELFVEELPQAKRATWMANWEWQDGPRSLQLLVMPRPGIDRLSARAAGLPVRATQPATSLANTSWAARYGFEAVGWTADLMAVRGWQTTPTLVPVLQASGVQLAAAVARQNSLAFSADKPLGPLVLRIEGLHARVRPDGQEAPSNDPALAPPAVPNAPRAHSQSTLGAGLDLTQGAWFLAGQVVAQQDSGQAAGSHSTALLSAIVQRKWLQDRLAARALHIRDTRSGSSWSSLQVSYEQSPHVVLQLQADAFRGDSAQAFGGLRDRSRVAATLRLQY